MKTSPLGEIITFYSYKGGTGRSMALANVACLLSQINTTNNVLMIDWDLEAPGLYRYFDNYIDTKTNKTASFNSQVGLIDLFYDIWQFCKEKNYEDEDIPENIFAQIGIDKYIIKTTINSLSLMSSGKIDSNYASRVANFNWEDFFDAYPSIIFKFSEFLSKKFQYVLIDSRTGHTDTSGICTTLMPDKLVVVFTPNNQSISGVLDLTKMAIEYRKQSDDLRKLIVFPLISRVEPAEPKMREDWRFGNRSKKLLGYQPQFENLYKDVYLFSDCNLTPYFDEIQIQYIPRYAYGEEIAVMSERSEDRLSLARSYENFVQHLVNNGRPWDYLSQKVSTSLSDKSKGTERTKKGRIEKTVFIAYRRKDISWALAVYQNLNSQSFDTFFDYTSIPSGDFEDIILANIKARAHFIIILTPSTLERAKDPNDWLMREIDVALKYKRNIVPLFFDGFDFSSPSISENLTGRLAELKKYNGLSVPGGYFDEAMERLRSRYLNVSLQTQLFL